ncbi:hypothetical protein [Pseudomonas asplenii]|uniref:hypothetical protein n=1 Tax=Pseudomonas asplenii TaxID=53407 RepID=UPI0003A817DC|nr:hypothetical protein [Pseudomonas fuscovaginae]
MHKKTCTEDDPDTGKRKVPDRRISRHALSTAASNRYQIPMIVRNLFGKLDDSLYSAKVWLDVSSLDPISGRPLNDRQTDVNISSESFHGFVGKIPHLL